MEQHHSFGLLPPPQEVADVTKSQAKASDTRNPEVSKSMASQKSASQAKNVSSHKALQKSQEMSIVESDKDAARYKKRLDRATQDARSFEDANATRYVDLKNQTMMVSAVDPSTMNHTGAMTAIPRREEAEYETMLGP